MTSAIEIHTHLLELQAERALASIAGLTANMGDLDEGQAPAQRPILVPVD